MFVIARIYDEVEAGSYRVLVDRLWPRGISKEKARLDLWAKDLTPSAELRKELHAGHLDSEDFKSRYLMELEQSEPAAKQADSLISKSNSGIQVYLLTAAKHEQHLTILKSWLESQNKGA